MLYFPNAKINIGLNILAKRDDGYHAIESVFYPIPLKDVLEIIPSEKFEFTVSGLTNISGDNLCVKAYQLIKQFHNIPPIKCHLHKVIPMGAGLGGGSADASFMLKALNSFFNLNITNSLLKEYALQLGSDCPFFIDNTPKYVTGRGEVMEDVNLDLKGYYLTVINPNIHISTQEAFSNIKINTSINSNFKDVVASGINNWKYSIKNDFEENIFKLYPQLADIKASLYESGAIYASMSGTGSTLYAFSEKEINLADFDSDYFKFQTKL